jgi:protein AFG1
MRIGPLQQYAHLIEKGSIKANHNQHIAAGILQKLHEQLEGYQPAPCKPESPRQSLLSSIGASFGFSKSRASPTLGPKGIYLYGGVGAGKSMLMDMFYNSATTTLKQRTHFHQFMQALHHRVHELRTVDQVADPIPILGYEIATKSWLLCFDEFQVTDIVDAMLLRRLCSELFKQGVVMIATSNRHPDELYLNGIQRKEFLPTIDLIKDRLHVLNLDAGLDFRKVEKQNYDTYSFSSSHAKLDGIWAKLTAGKHPSSKSIQIWGREFAIPFTCDRIAYLDFDELCGKPHSAADYLALCSEFDLLLIKNVPEMNLDTRNEARRFITLIDAVYDSKLKVCMHFKMETLDKLFTATTKSTFNTSSLEEIQESHHDEVFAFERTKSRLIEMRSRQWFGDQYASALE